MRTLYGLSSSPRCVSCVCCARSSQSLCLSIIHICLQPKQELVFSLGICCVPCTYKKRELAPFSEYVCVACTIAESITSQCNDLVCQAGRELHPQLPSPAIFAST